MRIGTMQGRLLLPQDGEFQCFPGNNWEQEFPNAQTAVWESIEWIYDVHGEDVNPILAEAPALPLLHPIFCGQTPLDTQGPSSYTRTVKKQCLINIIRHFLLGFPP